MTGNGLETVKSELDTGEIRGCVSWLCSEQKVGLGIGCWQGLGTGPAVGENCLHVCVPM